MKHTRALTVLEVEHREVVLLRLDHALPQHLMVGQAALRHPLQPRHVFCTHAHATCSHNDSKITLRCAIGLRRGGLSHGGVLHPLHLRLIWNLVAFQVVEPRGLRTFPATVVLIITGPPIGEDALVLIL